MCGVARRAWGRNENSIETVREHKRQNDEVITLPYLCSDTLIDEILNRNEGTEHGAETKPLEGITVVELAMFVAAPSAARMLADWGLQ